MTVLPFRNRNAREFVVVVLAVTVLALCCFEFVSRSKASADRVAHANTGANSAKLANSLAAPAGTSYTWIGGTPAFTTDWQVSTNWSPVRTIPAPGDVLVFNTGSPTVTNVPTQSIAELDLTGGAFVTLNAATIPSGDKSLTISGGGLSVAAGTSLTLAGSTSLTISVAPGSTGTVSGQIILQDTAHRVQAGDTNGITFQSGSIFTTSTGFSGNPFGTGTDGSVVFASGASSFFNAGSDPFGGSGHSIATFDLGSSQTFNAATAFSSDGRTYGNLTLDGSQSYSGSGANLLTIFNTLNIAPGSTLTLSNSSGGDLNLLGDITINGTLDQNGRAVMFQGGAAIQNINTAATFGNVIVSKIGGSVKLAATVTINGALQFNGTASAVDIIEFNAKTLNLNGTIGGTSTSTSNGFKGDLTGATLNIGGTDALGTLRFVSGSQTLQSLTLNRTSSGSVTLGSNLTIGNASSGSLTLTDGVIDAGSNTLSLASFPSISRTNGYLVGNLQKTFGATGAFTFAVGTANGYSPVDANITIGVGSSLTAKAVQGKHPNIPEPNALLRYWSISNSGSVTANLTFHYSANSPNDIVGTEANYKIFKYSGGFTGFTQFTPNTIGVNGPQDHFATLNGVSSFSDWTLADPTLTVNTTDDVDNGACLTSHCSLREAINAANFSSDPNTINFDPTAFAAPGPYMINLSAALPDLNSNMTITGPGANVLTVQRNTAGGTPDFRIFTISAARTVTITGMTVTNGKTANGVGGGGVAPGYGGQGVNGGGILNAGSLTLADVIVTGNRTGKGGDGTTGTGGFGGFGAGIHSSGTLTITNTTISNNTTGNGETGANGGSGGSGGGVFLSSGTLTITNSTISGNTTGQGADGANDGFTGGTGGYGGGLYVDNGTLNLTNVSITNNTTGSSMVGNSGHSGSGGSGGGILIKQGTITIVGSTISGNHTGDGVGPGGPAGAGGGILDGDILNAGTLTVINSTISGNVTGVSSPGGGGLGGGVYTGGIATFINSTISGNDTTGPGGAGGGFYSAGSLMLTTCTITGNSVFENTNGNGIYANGSYPAPMLLNTIVSGNGIPSASDLRGAFNSQGNNLIGKSDGSTGFANGVNGDKSGTIASPLNALLGPLANNGGLTLTHALLAGSPALDAGTDVTTLSNAIPDNSVTNINVTDATSIAAGIGFTILVDNEQMVVSSKAGNVLTVTRGANNTAAVSHSNGAGVNPAFDQRDLNRKRDAADADTVARVDIGAFEAQVSIEDIADKTTNEDTQLQFSFNVGDSASITSVAATSGATTLVPNNAANITVTGSGSTRTLTINPALNQSGMSTITVTVSGNNNESMTDTFVLTVIPVNDPPTDIALSNGNVADNSPSNTIIGAFATSDPDAGDTFTYSLVFGAGSVDNGSFTISGSQLRTNSIFDFETKSSYSLRVRSTDQSNAFFEKQFTISVIDGIDHPGAISFSSANYNVGEGSGNAMINLTRSGGADNNIVAKVTLTDVTTSPADYRFIPGTLDSGFNPGGSGATSGSSAIPQYVRAVALQPDGKIIIGGAFLFYDGTVRNRIARLNVDGTLDLTFDPGTGANDFVSAIALQPDGKIIIGGAFTTYNGSTRVRIARLNTDGTLDPTFGGVPDDVVRAAVMQPDGKIIIGGDFSNYNGTSSHSIARLNSDGSKDSSFNPGLGANAAVSALVLQGDGKLLVGGGFTNFGAASNTRLVRLNSNGSLDGSFTSATGLSLVPNQIALQSDAKVVVGGEFIGNDTPYGQKKIVRLNSNGSVDVTFDPGSGASNTVYSLVLQPDGKIIIGGDFISYNGTAVNHIARLNSAGALDPTFNPGAGPNSIVFAVSLQPDGKIIIGGLHTFYDGISSNGITRLSGDLFVTWAAGDSSIKTITLPIVDDSLDEGNETASLTLTVLTGGATVGANPSTLTIVDNDLTISSVSGGGTFGGTATLTAKLTSGGSNLNSKTVNFSLNGVQVGSASTVPSGFATLSGVSLSGIAAGTYASAVVASFPGDATFVSNTGTGPLTVLNDDTLRLILDESGPDVNQATAFDSLLFVRDPFHVQSIATWLNLGPDRNTRVIIFAGNLQLNQGESASAVVVSLVDANSQTFDVPAEDVRPVPNSSFTQVRFRLPDNLAAGVCMVTIKAHGQISNTGTIRIVLP